MNIREMIGQRLVFGFKGTELPQKFIELVREFKLGNVILFRYNVENTAQLRRLCAEIQELVRRETGHPAFITIDSIDSQFLRVCSTTKKTECHIERVIEEYLLKCS